MSQPTMPEIISEIERIMEDETLRAHTHYKDFNALPREFLERLVALAHVIGIEEQRHEKGETNRTVLRSKWLEMFGSTRDALSEGCVSLLGTGAVCGRPLEGDDGNNSQRCKLHRESHPFARVGHKAANGLEVTACKGKGVCLICTGKVTKTQSSFSCRSCEGRVHEDCIWDQYAGGEDALVGGNVICFCSACVIELFHEVLFMEVALRAEGADKIVVFEAAEERFSDPSDAQAWYSVKKELARQGLLGVQERDVQTGTHSPFAIICAKTPESVQGRSSRGTVDAKPMVERPPESSRMGRESLSRVEATPVTEPASATDEVMVLLRELLKEKSSGTRNQSDEYMHGGVDPTGLIDGFKSGELGAPNTLQFLSMFPYSGMNSSPKGTRSFIRRMTGANRLDLRTGDTFWPEAETKGEKIMVGDIELECQGTKLGVPDRTVVANYWHAAKREVLALRQCKRDVYSPDHKAYSDFQSTATLILLRIEFLEASVTYLQMRMDLQWGVIWRYLLAYMQDRFVANTVHELSDLDRRMLTTKLHGGWDMQVAGIVADTLMYHHITRAQEAVSNLVSKRLMAKGAVPVTTKEYARNMKCPLCLSDKHMYKQGAHTHPADAPITQACPRILTDGGLCGKRHAFTGPLRSPCRGDLEGAPMGRRA